MTASMRSLIEFSLIARIHVKQADIFCLIILIYVFIQKRLTGILSTLSGRQGS
jgi:hypothetical protein